MILRDLEAADVKVCATLHRRAFPGFFLSELGDAFLREFYRSFVDTPDAIAIVAVDNESRPIGVVVGTTCPTGFFRRLVVRRWWAFGLASIGLLFRRPRAVTRVLGAIGYRGNYPVELTGALLSSICVDPDAPRGTGQGLLAAFVDAALVGGVTDAHLVTDADGNDRVNRFYVVAGWRRVGSFSAPGRRRMNCYQWNGDYPSEGTYGS